MKAVFLTGASSFTGAYIAHAFKKNGWHVVASRSQSKSVDDNAQVKGRVEFARADEWIDDCPFGSEKMLDTLRNEKFSVFINHGAAIQGYRKADFDYLASVKASTANALQVCQVLKKNDCRLFLHSGSIFEAGEGVENPGSDLASEALSIYGVSKSMTWELLRFFARKCDLNIAKIVIPNPIGRFENDDRLIPTFLRNWRAGSAAVLRQPELIRDHLPAPWLAQVYVDEAERAFSESAAASIKVSRPSGYRMNNEKFVRFFLEKLRLFQPAASNYQVTIQKEESCEPLKRINQELCPELCDPSAEDSFWRDWLER